MFMKCWACFLFRNPQDEVGPSTSSSVVLCSFVLRFGILFVPILCTRCSYFSWYCFNSFTVFCTPVFSLIHRFFSLSSFVIPSKCLKNFICAASKRCSSLFFSTQASLQVYYCFTHCSWLNKVYILDYPYFSIIRALTSPPVPEYSIIRCRNHWVSKD